MERRKQIIFKSKAMENLVSLAEKVAKSEVTVLIEGESGTGKEVMANLIKTHSFRNSKPFIKVNCGAIPENLLDSELFGYEKGAFTGALETGKEGLFEMADGGTIFLDEIGTVSLNMQVKLLRVLQEREIMRVGGSGYKSIDVRIIVASNVNLKRLAEIGAFRSDLYYRLNIISIVMPPLRARKSDISPLVQYFLEIFNEQYGTHKRISENGWKVLFKYHWPGNVRELENIIERLVVTSESDTLDENCIQSQLHDLGVEDCFEIQITSDLKTNMEAFEKKLISSQMGYYKRSGELAVALGLDKSTLTRKIKKYGIKTQYKEE